MVAIIIVFFSNFKVGLQIICIKMSFKKLEICDIVYYKKIYEGLSGDHKSKDYIWPEYSWKELELQEDWIYGWEHSPALIQSQSSFHGAHRTQPASRELSEQLKM